MINASTLAKMAELKREEAHKKLAGPTVEKSDHADLVAMLYAFVRHGLAALRRRSAPASHLRTAADKHDA